MSRNVGFAVLYRGFSGDSSCSIGKKSWSAYLSFVSKHMLQNNLLYRIWHDWHCNSFIIHANNKNSAWYFYLSFL